MPLLSELGAKKMVEARFWPWIEPFSVGKSVKLFKLSPFSFGSSDCHEHLRRLRGFQEALTRKTNFLRKGLRHRDLQHDLIILVIVKNIFSVNFIIKKACFKTQRAG